MRISDGMGGWSRTDGSRPAGLPLDRTLNSSLSTLEFIGSQCNWWITDSVKQSTDCDVELSVTLNVLHRHSKLRTTKRRVTYTPDEPVLQLDDEANFD